MNRPTRRGRFCQLQLAFPASVPIAARRAIGPEARPLHGVTFLIVVDHDDSRYALRAALEQRGAVVRVASSAAGALAILRGEPIDLLISDVAMPEQDGYALIRQVRALDAATADTSAVALTALARDEDRSEALRSGFHRHFTKPVDVDALVEALQTLHHRENQTQAAVSGRPACKINRMFTWFRRDAEFLGYEAREVSAGEYELVVRQPDGTELVERFTDQQALSERQVSLQLELEGEGWTGPHGWNL